MPITLIHSAELQQLARVVESTKRTSLFRRLLARLMGARAVRADELVLRAKRTHSRHDCAIPVTLLRTSGKSIFATVSDMGLGGARIEPLAALAPDEVVRVRFGMPFHREARARVVWSMPRSKGGAAGLKFLEEPATFPVIRRIVTVVAGA